MNVFSKNKELVLPKKRNKNNLPSRLFEFIIGCLFVSLAYNIFMVPNNLVPGGVGGLAIIINNLFSINYVSIIIVLNIILLIASLLILDNNKTRSSILGTILFPIFVKLTENFNVWVQFDTSKVLLSTIFGGIIYGIGAGLVFKAGFTTGGTDIINQIISKYAKKSIGQSMLLSDGIIVLSTGLFLGINSMLYSIVILYTISIISDRIVLGISNNKSFYIITEKEKEVKKFIIDEMGHGVTIFDGYGGIDKKPIKVLMTILPTKEYYHLKDGIKRIDNKAFYIITDTYEVFGGE